MSLVLALKGKDGIVMASDSRATIGDPRGMTTANDTVQKVFTLNNKLILGMAGNANIGLSLIQEFKRRENEFSHLNKTIDILRRISCNKMKDWFGQPEVVTSQNILKRWPVILFLVAGYDREEIGIYTLNSTHNFAPEATTLNFSAIGVVPLAIYLLNRLHDPDASVESLKLLAIYCIRETATQDGKVGGPVQMTIIKENGIISISKDEINKLVLASENYNTLLKNAFYRGEVDEY
ncbi:MAG: hypothetical protein H0Z25_04130 [Kosmotoga sp.]|uniref:hypothetical protein n=1 Tax=Kosmotoga sp. TaxID=1955248 RepID=UPI001D84644F|nr:hypothetical protein [Kosmotoga sp.]MBO8166387.1 hypothetical protein [Kosmotoga sp.]